MRERFNHRWLLILTNWFLLSVPFPHAHAHDLTLAWDPSPEDAVAAYALYFAEAGASDLTRLVVGKENTGTITNLSPGKVYSIYVVAIADSGLESSPSNLIIYAPQALPTLANGGFESGGAGWTILGDVWVVNSASEGQQSVLFYSDGQFQTRSSVTQALSTDPGQRYTIRFDLGGFPALSSDPQELTVEVLGQNVLLLETLSISPVPGSIQWTSFEFAFLADSPTTLISFSNVPLAPSLLGPFLDNVQVGVSD